MHGYGKKNKKIIMSFFVLSSYILILFTHLKNNTTLKESLKNNKNLSTEIYID
uniref:Uncharacterized protein n=1 Tax=Physcomitrium patens TaxID=3218 RepID=A0A2K1JKV2_PHYPA|nr:hypothetical protein PHYPA_017017 [Physcomitrium patens]